MLTVDLGHVNKKYLFFRQSSSVAMIIGAPIRHSMNMVAPTAMAAPLPSSLVHTASCLLSGPVVTKNKFPSLVMSTKALD